MSAIKRNTPPSAPSPHPKPALTVEEWEAKAPLGDVETKSVEVIKRAAKSVPVILKVRPTPQFTAYKQTFAQRRKSSLVSMRCPRLQGRRRLLCAPKPAHSSIALGHLLA